MNIFITGASGFIGRSIVKKLLTDENIKITTLLLPTESEQLMEGLPVRIVRGDITETRTLSGLMDGHDTVIHLAGAVGYGQTMPHCLRINRDGTANVANEAVHSGIRRFCHFSSVSVYGRVPSVPIPETFPLRKTGDPYGDTKIDAENILTDLAGQGKLDLTVLRPTVIYGPGDVLFMPKLIENVQSGRGRVIGKGGNMVDLIHVDDVAEFVYLVLKDSRAIGQTYNLTHPKNPSWKEFMKMVTNELGLPEIKTHLPYYPALAVAGLMELVAMINGKKPRLTRYSVRVVGRQYHYLTEKSRRELDFFPKIKLEDGIKEELATYNSSFALD